MSFLRKITVKVLRLRSLYSLSSYVTHIVYIYTDFLKNATLSETFVCMLLISKDIVCWTMGFTGPWRPVFWAISFRVFYCISCETPDFFLENSIV